MADRPIYEVARGETYRAVLASALGEVVTGLTVACDIRRLPGGRNSRTPGDTVVASFTLSDFAGDATRGPGWYMLLPAATTAALTPGMYVADIKVTDAVSEITKSAHMLFDVQEDVTA